METSVSAPLANASGTMYSSLRVLLPPYARPLFTSSRLAQTEAPPRWAVSRSSGCAGLGPKVNGWRGNSCSLMRRVWTTASGRDDRPEQRQHPVGDLGLEGDHRRAAGGAVVGGHGGAALRPPAGPPPAGLQPVEPRLHGAARDPQPARGLEHAYARLGGEQF